MSSIDTQHATLDPGTACAPAATPRILFANSWSSCHGGSSIVLLQIVSHVDRERFDPVVLCPEPGDLPKRLEEMQIPVHLHRMAGLTRETAVKFLMDVMWYRRWLRREKISLIHMMGAGWRRSLAYAAHLCRIPYIVHIHNAARPHRSNFSYRWASRIIAVSNSTLQPFAQDERTRDIAKTIFNGIDLSLYGDTKDNRHELGATDRPVIGFVGQLIPRKGVRTLIESMPSVLQSCPQALLVLVGCAPPDEPEYERECRQLVKTLGIESRVVFAGYRQDVPAWMRTFDVFVLPTRAEPFGLVNVEAMAAHCPVVASAVGGIPEIISRPELGTLIPPDDPQATARGILKYVTDSELTKRTGAVAAAHVRENFSVDSMVRSFEQVYCDVLTEAGHG